MRNSLALLAFAVAISGCAPALTPLYRDFEDTGVATDPTLRRVERALEASSWVAEPGVTPNVVATAPRQFRSWGLYTVEVELEVVPMADHNVRILVHPYRRFFQGTRRKVPYLRRSLARSALADLNRALEAEGLLVEGTAESRDRSAGIR